MILANVKHYFSLMRTQLLVCVVFIPLYTVLFGYTASDKPGIMPLYAAIFTQAFCLMIGGISFLQYVGTGFGRAVEFGSTRREAFWGAVVVQVIWPVLASLLLMGVVYAASELSTFPINPDWLHILPLFFCASLLLESVGCVLGLLMHRFGRGMQYAVYIAFLAINVLIMMALVASTTATLMQKQDAAFGSLLSLISPYMTVILWVILGLSAAALVAQYFISRKFVVKG